MNNNILIENFSNILIEYLKYISLGSYFVFCLVFQLDSYRENFNAVKKERQKFQEQNGELQDQLEQLKIELEQQQKKVSSY